MSLRNVSDNVRSLPLVERIRWLDWRIWGHPCHGVVAIAATYLVYWLGYGHNPSTFFGAIFAGWIGGLALFVVGTLVVAIVSLVKPEQ